MTAHPIFDAAANGPDASFKASLLVMAEVEHLTNDGIGLLCRLVEGDGPSGADVMVSATIYHWAAVVLSQALVGDMVALAGRAEPVDAGVAQARPLLRVHNPASAEIWRRAASGPNSKHEFGGTPA